MSVSRAMRAVALSAAAVLFVAACGDDDGGQTGAPPSAEDVEDSAEDEAADDGSGDTLEDDVAAVVDDEEIEAAGIDAQVEALAENPQFAGQLEGEQGEQNLAMLRAEILTTTIHTRVAIEAAAELDQPVTDEDAAEARVELEDQVGGAEELSAAIEQQGLTESQVDDHLRGLAALSNIETALDEESGDDGSAEQDAAGEDAAPGDQDLSPSERAAQQFLGERLSEADVVVNADYGSWDPQASRVVPPGGAPPAAGGGSGADPDTGGP